MQAVDAPAHAGPARRDRLVSRARTEPRLASFDRRGSTGYVVIDALRIAYTEMSILALALDEPTSWRPTAGLGWTVRDLVQHLPGDPKRAQVALATPAAGPAAIHHLDTVVDLDHPGPRAEPLALTRGTLDGLLGRSTPCAWPDQQWVRAATGKGSLTDPQIAFLGSDFDRLPLIR